MANTYWRTIDGAAAFGFATQSTYDEANETIGDYTWLPCSVPSLSPAREYIEPGGFGGQPGAARPPKAGKRSGTLTFTAHLHGEAKTWTTASQATVTGERALLAALLGGSSVSTLQGGAIESPITTTDALDWLLSSGSLDVGAGAVAAASGSIHSAGVVKSVTGSDYTLSEDGIAVPTAGDDLLSAATLYPSNDEPSPYSFRFLGSGADQDIIYVGCTITGAKLSIHEGDSITCEFTARYTDWTYPSNGQAVTVPNLTDIPTVLGVNQSRMTLVGGSTGTADPDGDCGAGGLEIEIATEGHPIAGYGGAQGECGYVTTSKTITATVSIPHTSALVSGSSLSYDAAESMSLLAQVGTTAGRFVMFHLPAAVLTAQTAIEVNDNVVGYKISLRAGPYTGDDSGATAPGNTPARIIFA